MYRALITQETISALSLAFIQHETQSEPDCAIIWLHGLGANGHDFEPLLGQLELPNNFRVRFIFPHAPIQAVSLNGGMQMPAWYDIHGLDMHSQEDSQGIHSISREIDMLIEQQIELGISANRIILAGFSQGGALTLFSGLQTKYRLAGLLALSCYLPIREQLPVYATNADRTLPIFISHGLHDDVVPLNFAELAVELLQQQNFTVQWQRYNCAHNVCAEQIADIRGWILKVLDKELTT